MNQGRGAEHEEEGSEVWRDPRRLTDFSTAGCGLGCFRFVSLLRVLVAPPFIHHRELLLFPRLLLCHESASFLKTCARRSHLSTSVFIGARHPGIITLAGTGQRRLWLNGHRGSFSSNSSP